MRVDTTDAATTPPADGDVGLSFNSSVSSEFSVRNALFVRMAAHLLVNFLKTA